MPSRRSVPGVLPDWSELAGDVEDVVGRAGTRRRSARRSARSAVDDVRRRAGEHARRTRPRWRSASRSCRPARRGSGRSGRRPSPGPDRLADLAGDQPLERLRPGSARPRARGRPVCSRPAANRKSPVRIATVLSQRALADAAPRRTAASSITSSWYSVARWVSSTTDGGRHDAGGGASPNWAASSATQRPEPLAAGVDQVTARPRRRTGPRWDRTLAQQLPRPRQAVAHRRRAPRSREAERTVASCTQTAFP